MYVQRLGVKTNAAFQRRLFHSPITIRRGIIMYQENWRLFLGGVAAIIFALFLFGEKPTNLPIKKMDQERVDVLCHSNIVAINGEHPHPDCRS